MATYRFTGEVFDKSTNLPSENIQVEALDLHKQVKEPVAVAVSNAQGEVEITVTDETLRHLFGDATPCLYFRLTQANVVGGNVVGSTEETVRWDGHRNGRARFLVDTSGALGSTPAPQYVVEGTLVDTAGEPVASTLVRVCIRELASGGAINEPEVATGTTSNAGKFRIAYTPATPGMEGVLLAPDLVLKVLDALGTTTVAKATICRATPRARVDVVKGGTPDQANPGLTERARIQRALATVPLDLNVADVTPAQVTVLACQANTPEDEVAAYVNAIKLSTARPTVDTDTFFSFMRFGIGGTEDDVFAHRLPTLRRIIQLSAASHVIRPDAAETTNLDATMVALETVALSALRATGGDKLRLGRAVDLATNTTITLTHRDNFLKKALNFEGTADEFWADIDATSTTEISDTAKKHFKFMVEATSITGAHEPTVAALYAQFDGGAWGAGPLGETARGIATRSIAQLEALIGTNFPTALYASATEYAEAIYATAGARYRTARIRSKVQAGSPEHAFLSATQNVDFEFENQRAQRYFNETPGAFTGMTEATVKPAILELERLIGITETWEDLASLKNGGVGSAFAAHALGKDGLAAILPAASINNIYAKACWTTAASEAMGSTYNAKLLSNQFVSVLPNVTSKVALELPPKIADWESLFGSLDQCECKHCASVLSPSAYLVDVLEMLKKVGPTGDNARDALLDRRPDIGLVGLTCDNAHTPLPYVDLCNEIMEVKIAAPSPYPTTPNPVLTTATAEELAAHPEILYPDLHITAYNTLDAQVHPFATPFNLWQEEARVYLDHLRVSRETLIEEFARAGDVITPHLAMERLRVARSQYSVIATNSTANPHTYWGLPAATWRTDMEKVIVFMQKSGLEFEEVRELLNSNFCSSQVPAIKFADDPCDLDAMSITGFLSTPDVTAGDPQRSMLHKLVRLKHALGFSIADTDRARVAMQGGVSAAIDSATLHLLAGLKRVVSEKKVSAKVGMNWYGPIDRHTGHEGDPCLYQRVFLDRKATSPSYPAFAALLPEGGSTTKTLGDARPALAAGVSLSDADLMLLIDDDAAARAMGLDASHALTDTLSVANAGELYAAATFSRAIGRSLRDTIVLAALAGGDDGFSPVRGLGTSTVSAASPDRTIAFDKVLKRFARTGLSVDEVQYIVRGFAPTDTAVAPTDDEIATGDAELVSEIEKAANEAKDVSDPDGAIVAALGSFLLGDKASAVGVSGATWATDTATYTTSGAHELVVGDWVVISGVSPSGFNVAASVETVPDSTSFTLTLDEDPGTFTTAGSADTSATRGLKKLVHIIERAPSPSLLSLTFASPFLGDVTDATANLVTVGTRLDSVERRRTYVAQRLSRYVGCRAAAIAWASRTFGLEADVMASLLGTAPDGTADALSSEDSILTSASDIAVRAFIPNTNTAWTAPKADDTARKALAKKIHKAALVVKRVQLSVEDLAILYPNGEPSTSGLPAVSLDGLPEAQTAPSPTSSDERMLFDEILRLGDYTWVRSRYPGREKALAALFANTGTVEAHYDQVEADTGITRADIERLSTRLLVSPAPADFHNEKLLLKIFEGIELLRRLGASATTVLGDETSSLQGWRNVEAGNPTPDPESAGNARVIAREIKAAARAKHGDEAWKTIGKEIRDVVRDKQRIALSQALLTILNVDDTNALFERLLVDVEMSPCAITSRMVQAHGSVQTFVNRIQLNLEEGFSPSKTLSKEWDWMFAYRLWEANRKVFLWPENWIEPELRDTKTPLFEELETSLLQGPLTDDNVEDAYRKYLDGLADIANLEIVATHNEVVSEPVLGGVFRRSSIHVFGRTPSPHRYYHREKTAEGWGPWRKIDIDIQTDHLLPITVNGTLYLFWTQIEDVPNGKQGGDEEPTPLGCKVSLGVAALRRGQWTVVVGRSTGVELDVSINRSLLCLTGKVNGGGIEMELLHRWTDAYVVKSVLPVATFDFRLSDRKVSGAANGTLGSFVYVSNVNSVLPFGITPENVFGNGSAYFQGYRSLAGQANDSPFNQLYAYLESNGEPAKWLPLVYHGDSRVVVDRRQEPVKERGTILFQAPEGSFHLGLRSKKGKPNQVSGLNFMKANFKTDPEELPLIKYYEAELFHHPYVDEFRKRIALQGLDGLVRPRDNKYADLPQYLSQGTGYLREPFGELANFPDLEVQFDAGTAYAEYNWELFFHAPFLIANRLHQEGRFAEARRWYHVIFDPTCGWDPEEPEQFYNKYAQFWKFKPFAENLDLADIQEELNGTASNTYAALVQSWANGHPEDALSDSLKQQIAKWRKDPFDPHAIARMRIVAYQKAVVQKYVENLIAWGDQLFTQLTMESVNEATQLYIHALQLLGRKPTIVSKPEPLEPISYDGMPVDAFSNPLIALESISPPYSGDECKGVKQGLATVYGSTYFCVPENEKLFGLWDIIEDRLFKIRHCQNIEGVVVQIPLFQPPIDPALLVRAAAAGLDLRSVLNDLYVSAPPYRYVILAARAMDYAGAVTSLGASVLSALEKEDGEELARLRAGHDVANQRVSRDIRKQQVAEAKESLESVKRSLKTAEARQEYYASREFMSRGEKDAMTLGFYGELAQGIAEVAKLAAAETQPVPETSAGPPTAHPSTTSGGPQIAATFGYAADASLAIAGALRFASATVGTIAGYDRRMDDWEFQAAQAKLEIAQLEKQIIAAEIRVAIAEHELKLVEQQIDQVKEVEDFLKSKFTNRELYGWMKGQLAAVYQQSYQLAYEMARNAERAFQLERGDTSQTFIKFGAWDGFRKGLMAGEKLALDIRRMDAAYHTQNKREHEIVKTVSIAQLNPDAFMMLRAGNNTNPATALYKAEFSMPEAIFDDDFPNHHMRRIRNVNVTVQCTPGPYQSVSGKLTLFKSETRIKPQDAGRMLDTRIAEIATSTASNDTGMFELNFRDERYLPFEHRGVSYDLPVTPEPFDPYAQGQWRFELLGGNEMDFDSVTDLIMQIRYSAREGRSAGNQGSFANKRSILRRIPSAHADLFAAFKNGTTPNIVIPMSANDFPKGKKRNFATTDPLKKVVAYARWAPGTTTQDIDIIPGGTPPMTTSNFGSYRKAEVSLGYPIPAAGTTNWTFTPSSPLALQDLWVAFYYELS